MRGVEHGAVIHEEHTETGDKLHELMAKKAKGIASKPAQLLRRTNYLGGGQLLNRVDLHLVVHSTVRLLRLACRSLSGLTLGLKLLEELFARLLALLVESIDEGSIFLQGLCSWLFTVRIVGTRRDFDVGQGE